MIEYKRLLKQNRLQNLNSRIGWVYNTRLENLMYAREQGFSFNSRNSSDRYLNWLKETKPYAYAVLQETRQFIYHSSHLNRTKC